METALSGRRNKKYDSTSASSGLRKKRVPDRAFFSVGDESTVIGIDPRYHPRLRGNPLLFWLSLGAQRGNGRPVRNYFQGKTPRVRSALGSPFTRVPIPHFQHQRVSVKGVDGYYSSSSVSMVYDSTVFVICQGAGRYFFSLSAISTFSIMVSASSP